MLEIRNRAGLILELPVDQKLSVEINSTIFDTDDIIRGSYSYPFKFGLNQNNRRFLQHGHLVESALLPEIAVIVTAGSYSFSAKMTYKTSGKYADGALLINLGEVAFEIKNTPLREFVSDSFSVATVSGTEVPTLLELALAEPGAYPVVFPPFLSEKMIEDDFEPEPGYTKPTVMNFYDLDTGEYTGCEYGEGEVVMVPMMYVTWLIKYIAGKLGLSPMGSLFTDPNLATLVFFNTQSTPGYDTTGMYTVQLGRHLPDMSISDLFKKLRAYLGLSIEINTSTRTAVFNTYKSLSENTTYLDVSNAVVANTDGVDSPNSLGFVVKTNVDDTEPTIYRAYTVDEFSLGMFSSVSSFTVGPGNGTEVPLEIGTLAMTRQGIPGTGTGPGPKWLLPKSHKDGNLADPFFRDSENYSPYSTEAEPDKVPQQTNPYGLTMLGYFGMRPTSTGELYPYASSVCYDSKYEVFPGVALRAGEPDDVWNQYQRAYYEFLAFSKEFSVLLRLSLSQLNSITPYEPVGVRLANLVLGKYLLKRLTYELPEKSGFVLGKFEGVQLVPTVLSYTERITGGNIWFQVALENKTRVVTGARIEEYYDVVFYLWMDGAYTTPTTTEAVNVNYLFTNMLRKADGTRLPRVDKKLSFYMNAHRIVVSPGELLTVYGEIDYRDWRDYAYFPINGQGYRVR